MGTVTSACVAASDGVRPGWSALVAGTNLDRDIRWGRRHDRQASAETGSCTDQWCRMSSCLRCWQNLNSCVDLFLTATSGALFSTASATIKLFQRRSRQRNLRQRVPDSGGYSWELALLRFALGCSSRSSRAGWVRWGWRGVQSSSGGIRRGSWNPGFIYEGSLAILPT